VDWAAPSGAPLSFFCDGSRSQTFTAARAAQKESDTAARKADDIVHISAAAKSITKLAKERATVAKEIDDVIQGLRPLIKRYIALGLQIQSNGREVAGRATQGDHTAFMNLNYSLRQWASTETKHEAWIDAIAKIELSVSTSVRAPLSFVGLHEQTQFAAEKLTTFTQDVLRNAEKAVSER
jgi:hypothetical protein